MEGLPVLADGNDRLSVSVADAITSRDEEIRELWSLVEQKDADLRSAAELGKMLLDEKEEDAEAHEGEKEALWRRIQEMARRIMELEQEATELREVAAHQHKHHEPYDTTANGDPSGSDPTTLISSLGLPSSTDEARALNDDYQGMMTISIADSNGEDGGVHGLGTLRWKSSPGARENLVGGVRAEERALRAKNEMLERQLAHMKEAAEEAQLELDAMRKARFGARGFGRGAYRSSSISSPSATTATTASTTVMRSRGSSYAQQQSYSPAQTRHDRLASPLSNASHVSGGGGGGSRRTSYSSSKKSSRHRRARSSSGRVQADLSSWFASPQESRGSRVLYGEHDIMPNGADEHEDDRPENEEGSEVSEEALRNADQMHASSWRDQGSENIRIATEGERHRYGETAAADRESEGSIVDGETCKDKVQEVDTAWLLEQNGWLVEQLESKDELIEALRAQLEEASRNGGRGHGNGHCPSPGQHPFFYGDFGESDEDSDDKEDNDRRRGMGIRERSFLDDLLAGGASGGGVGSAAFLPYSTRTHASAAEAVVATRSSSEARASGSVAGSNSSGGMSTVKEAGEGLHTDVETPSKNSADGRPFRAPLADHALPANEESDAQCSAPSSPVASLRSAMSPDASPLRARKSMSPGRRREGLNSPFRALGSGSIVKKLNGIGLSFGETTPASGASGTSEGGVEIIAEVVHETRGAAPSASPPRSSPMADKDAQDKQMVSSKSVVSTSVEVPLSAMASAVIIERSEDPSSSGEPMAKPIATVTDGVAAATIREESIPVVQETVPHVEMPSTPLRVPTKEAVWVKPHVESPSFTKTSSGLEETVASGKSAVGTDSAPPVALPRVGGEVQGARGAKKSRRLSNSAVRKDLSYQPPYQVPILCRAERKSRQAMDKLGLRPVKEVFRMTMKASNGVIFAIANPDVFKHPKQNIYVVFGMAETEKPSHAGSGGWSMGYSQRPPSYATVTGQGAPTAYSVATSASPPKNYYTVSSPLPASPQRPDPEALESKAVSAGVDPADVMTIVSHVDCDLDAAISALRHAEGDIVNAVMSLTNLR